ncbi:MAG: branched-chain amino acid ABC transporter permease [Desulfobulbaceae bacterium]|jgi:branched-chain amino acid transport system permease protein|nr:branched-chain amino acid ABC transporter permease [Desulfobulbaceae bacterium]
MTFPKRYLAVAGLLAMVVGIQQLTALTGTAYYLTQLTMAAYYSLLIIGLCLLMGYTGQLSLGHAGFFAIGGYISAALTTHDFSAHGDTLLLGLMEKTGMLMHRQSLYGEPLLNVHPWPACFIAIGMAVLVALVLGVPVLRLKGHYLAMATLGFGIIIYRVVLASEFFGEADGISEVPAFNLLPGLSVNGDFAFRVTNYYIAWGLLLLGLVLLLNLIHSRVGRALRSIHGSEEAAEAMGVDTSRYKLYIFVISAAFAAAAGSFLAHYNGGIGPSEAGVMKSVRYVAIVAVGGMANLWGALLMGVLLNFMSLRGMFGTYDDAVFGIILILIMLFAPRGILSLRMTNVFRARAKTPGE